MGRLLVTGAGGLVGSQFLGDLVRISSKEFDLRSQYATDKMFDYYTNKNIFKENVVDKVIHCATTCGV